VRWGSDFADFENDGWPDIVVANGNLTSLDDAIPGEPRYGEPLHSFATTATGPLLKRLMAPG